MKLYEHFLPDPLPVPITEGKLGRWRIETFEITEKEAERANSLYSIRRETEYCVKPGNYTRLIRDGHTIVMSNTPMEVTTNAEFIKRAWGCVLINGLGLGMVLRAVLDKPEVEHVTVYEIDQDLIDLVSPAFKADSRRVLFLKANCLEYKPFKGETYDIAWHDIWDFVSASNLPDMARLKRKWLKRVPIQMFWARRMCERDRRN